MNLQRALNIAATVLVALACVFSTEGTHDPILCALAFVAGFFAGAQVMKIFPNL